MRIRRIIFCVLAIATLATLMAVTQSDDAIQSLRQAIADMGLRIDKLEAAAGAGGGSSNSGGGASAPAARSMVLVSVHIANVPQDQAEEIANLQQQCDALNSTINASADAAAGAIGNAISNNTSTHQRGGVSGWRGSGGGSSMTAGGGMGVAQTAGDIETEQRYGTLHVIKMKQLQALQDSANTPKQILIGHNDTIIFTLNSKVDLTDALNNIPIGATVSWTGTRVSADDKSEVWRISSVQQVGSN